MIDLYAWRTGNGRKPIIALEELGLDYRIHPIDISGRGGREMPEYLKIHPVGQVPAMVDSDGPGGKPIKLFESVVILMYLAEKAGKLLPADPAARWETVQWTVFHAASSVAVLDQLYWFINHAPEQPPYVIKFYREESENRLGVLDRLLEGREWLVGEYSIADIAHYSPINSMEWFNLGIDISKFPNLSAWRDRMTARPAVARAMSFLPEPA
jgi:GST-like protein